jgi:hypothetical protein
MRCQFFSCVAVLVLSNSLHAGTVTGTVRKLDGTPNNQLSNFTLQATFGGVAVGNGILVNANLGTFRVDIDDNLLRTVSQQLTGEVNVSVVLSFNADNAVPATLTGVAGTSISSIDVVMPKREPCRHISCDNHRHRLFRRR